MNLFKNLFKFGCPYCGKVLEKRPARKTKCLHCGRFIFVRNKKLMTEQDAAIIDTNNKFSVEYEIPLKIIQAERDKLLKKIGFQPKESDVRWGLFNWLIIHTRDNGKLARIYSDMVLHLNKEGKDDPRILQLAAKFGLKEIKDSGTDNVEILTDPEACDECEKFNNKQFDVNIALNQQFIPNKKCKTKWNNGRPGFCRCIYQPVIDEMTEELAQKILTEAKIMNINEEDVKKKSFSRDTLKFLQGINKLLKFIDKIFKFLFKL